MSRFCVAGSINIDLVTNTPHFPKPGETMYGSSFNTFNGGKGANQAVALAKLGAETSMAGMVGNDIYADNYINYFKSLGVDTKAIGSADTSTGIAVITVDGNGENSIIIVPGANAHADSEYIMSKEAVIAEADYLLLQLEIPMSGVIQAAKSAAKHGTKVILDPAPAAELSNELLKCVDIITPNETEAAILTGIRPSGQDTFRQAGEALTARGVKTAVLKAGVKGVYIFENGKLTHIAGFKVNTVDTTAAGDTFNAGLAYALGNGLDVYEAARFANAAAAISTTKQGAQTGMPSINEVTALLGRQI